MGKKEYLRLKAEELMRSNGVADKTLYEKDLESLIEELRIHQFELEHQNQELMEAHEKIVMIQNRFTDLFNYAPIGYMILSNNYKITEVNFTACKILNLEYDLLKNTSFTKWIHPDFQDQFYLFFKDIFVNPDFKSCELKLKDASGFNFFASIIALPDQYTNGKSQELRIAIIDISMQKELEFNLLLETERAKESERLKSAFLANMSHEIRTPLNGILGFASLIYDDEPDTPTAKSYAEIIGRNGERLLNLINKILDISKIESGNMPVENTTFSPGMLISEVKELFQVIADKQDVNIVTHISPELSDINIIADKSKLTQILTNLLSNALKFTKNGFVEIGYYREGNQIVFTVKDNGLGISEEGQKHLFERFYQVNTNSKYNTEGSGLGLSLCKALVELLNGRIWVESKAGEGACFSFSISCEFIDDKNSKSADLPNQTVLLVEDDFKQAQLIKAQLEKYNLQVVYAKNGVDAIQQIMHNNSLSMILMDINMPVLNGLETAREIRKNNIHIPIVAITGFSTEYTQHDAIQLGFNDYFVKPLTTTGISRIIHKYITV